MPSFRRPLALQNRLNFGKMCGWPDAVQYARRGTCFDSRQ